MRGALGIAGSCISTEHVAGQPASVAAGWSWQRPNERGSGCLAVTSKDKRVEMVHRAGLDPGPLLTVSDLSL